MTTKTDITQERAAFEAWHERLYGRRPVRKGGGYAATAHTDRWTTWLACRAAVEADRRDHIGDATGMVPSDEQAAFQSWAEIEYRNEDTYSARDYRMGLDAWKQRARYSSGQHAASAEPNAHTDDDAVDRFAAAMKDKLAQARAKGRHGWQECDPSDLSQMLRAHVEKGDPRDVANFCCFLWSLGKPISAAPVAQDPVGIAGAMPGTSGFTLAALPAADVPVGTKLYAAPVAAQAQPSDQDREDAERMDWLDNVAHCADWLEGEPTKRVIRASDGAEFTGDTWREAIDAARVAKGVDHA